MHSLIAFLPSLGYDKTAAESNQQLISNKEVCQSVKDLLEGCSSFFTSPLAAPQRCRAGALGQQPTATHGSRVGQRGKRKCQLMEPRCACRCVTLRLYISKACVLSASSLSAVLMVPCRRRSFSSSFLTTCSWAST